VILLLDTNTCIYLINQHPLEVLRKFNEYAVGDIGISSVTAAEWHFGVHKSQRPEENRRALEQFLLPLNVAPFDENAAAAYGHVRAQLEKQGTLIGPLDTLIAAHALSLDLTLVTNNLREFERVPGLEAENWTVA
jgi:tRNA(fMet)-specific endonuclease VapC